MRTAFFVDGYNLYYGLLRGSPHKWLDLGALLDSILRVQDPSAFLDSVHYFTAPVIAKLATRGQLSNDAQHRYIRALQAKGVHVTLGNHRLGRGYAPLYLDGKKSSRLDQVAIWELEEKETDVNLALGMYRSACKSHLTGLSQIVLVSGDTDLSPALSAIREDFPHIALGIILPHRQEAGGVMRNPPGSLKKCSDWMRTYISDSELEACQLPAKIPLPRKPAIVKPDYW
ncbi:NYN domain-containing protein [Halopseudomonas phragmitis]|uniref:NYN domain-containing protein n=1 Tax=Halopseudomonas phragmitis TaxID=1931241 RepID=A0A1V0B160_9GAMM|nr:NYN domain-containing protein [Halopseudomonas phragmitis]AQZ93645.1 NYN domain-containing protein [Halopseudomonas phragmitis]